MSCESAHAHYDFQVRYQNSVFHFPLDTASSIYLYSALARTENAQKAVFALLGGDGSRTMDFPSWARSPQDGFDTFVREIIVPIFSLIEDDAQQDDGKSEREYTVHDAVNTYFNKTLVAWAKAKYKKFKGHKARAAIFVQKIAKREPHLFAHWKIGMVRSFA